MNDARPQTASPAALPLEDDYRPAIVQGADGSRGPTSRGPTGSDLVGPLEAMRRHWVTVLITVVSLAGAGIALGLVREPVYTAEASLSVQIAASSPSTLPGSVTVANELASTYGRSIEAEPVVRRLVEKTPFSRRQVVARISATQVPETPVVSVSATGSSERATIVLANLAATELRRYVDKVNRQPSAGSDSVLRQFKQALRRLEERSRRQRRLEQRAESFPSFANKAALKRARVKTEVAKAQRDGLRIVYQSGQQHYTAPLEILSRPTGASSDRVPRLQLLGLIGLAAGLAVGAVLATSRANAAAMRRPS